MKRALALILCGAFAVTAFAADVYDVRLSCKVPAIKQASAYYKDVTAQTYRGFLEIAYNADGTVSNTCKLVVYGTFPEGKAVRVTELGFDTFSMLGKKLDKFQCTATADLGDFTVALAGFGAVKTCKGSGCGPGSCPTLVYPDAVSGTLTGWTGNVVCGACGGESFAYDLNNCADNPAPDSDYDAVSGTWAMRKNATLTKACATATFESVTDKKIPAAYAR